jgi:hypothetical protein
LTADQISHIVPSSLLKKSESIYNQLLNSWQNTETIGERLPKHQKGIPKF